MSAARGPQCIVSGSTIRRDEFSRVSSDRLGVMWDSYRIGPLLVLSSLPVLLGRVLSVYRLFLCEPLPRKSKIRFVGRM